MRIHQENLEIETRPRRLVDITREVQAIVARSGVASGLCSVFVRHTSAGLVIQENADPAVLRDLARWLEALAPESTSYEHDDEGPDDMPAHLRSVVTRTAETIPVERGRLAFGTWQALYLYEHRARGRRRQLAVSVIGDG